MNGKGEFEEKQNLGGFATTSYHGTMITVSYFAFPVILFVSAAFRERISNTRVLKLASLIVDVLHA